MTFSTFNQLFSGASHYRTILVAVARIDGNSLGPVYLSPLSNVPTTLDGLMFVLEKLRTAKGPSGASTPSRPTMPLPASGSFRFFAWDGRELNAESGVSEIPRPGVLIALFGTISDGPSVAISITRIQQDLSTHPEVREFLQSPAAQAAPVRFLSNDVFLSYSSKDKELADELHSDLVARGLTVFMAEKSIGIAARWEPEIRRAIRRSKVVSILLTPNSKSSHWVLLEAGAAWALDVPIALAFNFVGPDEIPSVLQSFQGRQYSTLSERRRFADEMLSFCSRGSGDEA